MNEKQIQAENENNYQIYNQKDDDEERVLYDETREDIVIDFNLEKKNIAHLRGKYYIRYDLKAEENWEDPKVREECEKLYKNYKTVAYNEEKKAKRERRCWVWGEKRDVIRCPDNRSCYGCQYEFNRSTYHGYMEQKFLKFNGLDEQDKDNKSIRNVKRIFYEVGKVNPDYIKIVFYRCKGMEYNQIAELLGVNAAEIYKANRKIKTILRPLAREMGFRV